MTHPDILAIEKFGSLNAEDSAERIGYCIYCDEAVSDGGGAMESRDGLFCDESCMYEYYEIRER